MTPLIIDTGHDIADTVAKSLSIGFQQSARYAPAVKDMDIQDSDFVIGYGILRGTAEVFKRAEALGKPWFVIDKGYFGAGHYDGYYRMGYKGTQGPYIHDHEPLAPEDMAIMPEPMETTGVCGVICPPTNHVAHFYRIDKPQWIKDAIKYVEKQGKEPLVREKDTNRRLEEDLAQAAFVYTFNSGVGWNAVARGIPVISDKKRSIVGQWNGKTSNQHFISYLMRDQFTLKDVEEGKLWARVTHCLCR